MPDRSAAFKACALLLASLFLTHAHATPQPLAEAEMSAVRGADGSILVGLQPSTSSSNSQNPLTAGLSAAFASSTGATLLTPEQFATALQGAGLTPSMLADYAGQPVAQIVVDAKPVTFSFNFSDILQSTTGLQVNGGPSMGTITLKDFDARGTTIWVWTHH
ncbi:MAG TPA: hypothetical protein VES00_05010 [Burkholderiaceae bacterium]|jgi:hypothetical protein|nr:hypothetical protein [Burkholderiaceae bacterium]